MQLRPKLIALVALMAVAVGCSVAFFLWSLEAVTRVRFENPWLLWFLPVAGMGVVWLYHRHGGDSEGGNNLILDRLHDPGGGVPRRMAPLVLFGTLVTHLFGGSAGREGTAVQMGGSIASAVARQFRLDAAQLPALLMAGVAAGFGAVFGTPLAGAVFAVEVVMIGRPKLRALPVCLLASYLGDWTCRAWGVGHAHYHIDGVAGPLGAGYLDLGMVGKVALAAVAFGLVGWLFAAVCHWLSAGLKRWIPNPVWRPAVGGVGVIVLFLIVGRADYLGLGVWSPDPAAVTLASLFESPGSHPWAWLWKLAFTAVTVSSGFKGGEVTPLFFIGAALGSALAGLLGAPPELFAGLGMVAVFAGASNTPVASTLMGIELFGLGYALPIALACGVAFLCSGHAGIYPSQRFALKKPFWRRPR
ncbi:voltage-gated chloride channel family protein [Luteolibacter arcticus]|uniref:Voltage-gated chloride channel family protein n=1 Tax=Luteolibacter arcticus TaxID=1581411 RepID=A0ABT3GBX2_9BACT|nr:voltage-gated chloride channel family protein [Luteolibacter arcticus]MCW1921112.1 voltage-gated chloride channel family protein [Luteolibacter arcticus]